MHRDPDQNVVGGELLGAIRAPVWQSETNPYEAIRGKRDWKAGMRQGDYFGALLGFAINHVRPPPGGCGRTAPGPPSRATGRRR